MVFPEAWRYRDWVIESFNGDLPFDRFVVAQLAGDLLPAESPAEEAANLVATGYLVLGATNYEEQDKKVLAMDVVDEQLDTLGKGLLGMTIGCARCHDHKFDPIPTSDYYALAGILRSTDLLAHENVSRWKERPLPVDAATAAAVAAHEADLAAAKARLAAAKHARANLRGPLPRHAVETAIRAYRGYATYLRTDAPKLTAGVGDAELQREVTISHDALARAADDLASWLEKSELPRADLSHALGEARFLGFVRAQEGIAVDVKTFRADAEADLAKNRSAFEAERKKKGAALVRPKASELLPLATAMADESRAFVVGKGLVSIPSADGAVVKETPPFMRYNSAFLSAPGAFEKPGLLAFYYITPPDPTWPKREQNEYLMPRGTLLSTTVHEVVPGHFLQALFVRRAPTRAQRLFGSYSFVEGWAHYAEEMMLEEGFGASEPSARAGQLADALLRNCRWTGAIELHVDRRKVSDVAKRFERECGQDAASAREQAARGTFDPGYFAYTFGKRELFALRAELKRRLGNRFDLRTFHDAVLSHGAPPLPLLRDRVLRDLAPID